MLSSFSFDLGLLAAGKGGGDNSRGSREHLRDGISPSSPLPHTPLADRVRNEKMRTFFSHIKRQISDQK